MTILIHAGNHHGYEDHNIHINIDELNIFTTTYLLSNTTNIFINSDLTKPGSYSYLEYLEYLEYRSLDDHHQFRTNDIITLDHILNNTKLILNIPKDLYKAFGSVRKWTIPRRVDFKTVSPGEQATGTFHKKVYDDKKLWFKSDLYQ